MPEMHVWRAQLGMLRHQVPDWATAWAAEEGTPHAEAWRMRSAPSCPCAALHCIHHDLSRPFKKMWHADP